MTDERRIRHPVSTTITLPTFAIGAAVLWAVLEFSGRRGLVPPLADLLGTGLGADAIVLAVGFPVIAGIIAWLGRRVDIGPADWEYSFSLRSLLAGVVGCVGYLAVYVVIVVVYVTVLGFEPTLDASAFGAVDAPTWALLVFFAGNGIIVPIAEELAWRGVIQTALTDSYGTYVAVVVTAIAFVLKHLLVDMAAPPLRVASLVVLALVFGILRARYGTASSTVAHLGANTIATATLLLG